MTITVLLIAAFLPIALSVVRGWNLSLARDEATDERMRAAIRLQADVATAELFPIAATGTDRPQAAFSGSADQFVFVCRCRRGAGDSPLELVGLSIDDVNGKTALVRRFADFADKPFSGDARSLEKPVAVLSGDERMYFTYIGSDGTSTDTWAEQTELPQRVELRLRGQSGTQNVAIAPLVFVLPVRAKLTVPRP